MRYVALIICLLSATNAFAEDHPAEALAYALFDSAAQPRITPQEIADRFRKLVPDENVLRISDMGETAEPGNWDSMISFQLPPQLENMPGGTEISVTIGCRSIGGASFTRGVERFQQGGKEIAGQRGKDDEYVQFLLGFFDEAGLLNDPIPANADALLYCNGSLMTKGFDPLDHPRIRKMFSESFGSVTEQEVVGETQLILYSGSNVTPVDGGQIMAFQLTTKRDIMDFRPQLPVTQFFDFRFVSFALVEGS